MACLLDTGILLRLIDRDDRLHDTVNQSIERLGAADEEFVTATQNIAELWSVATRPASDNGLGVEPVLLYQRVECVIEPLCEILSERADHYATLKGLLLNHPVRGKQIHDTRLIAAMLSWGVPRILTLNPKHFQRFAAEGIEVLTPESISDTAG